MIGIRGGFATVSCVALALGAVAPPAALAASFSFTGKEQEYAVPAGVTRVHVVAVGASGNSVGSGMEISAGGQGAVLTADVPLPSGTSTLYVEVGGNGIFVVSANDSTSGGFNGGGGGPSSGGGASDIRTVSCDTSCVTGGGAASLASRLAVAGGGGGASENLLGGNAGRAGGSGEPRNSELSGGGATVSSPGSGETGEEATSFCQGFGDTDGEPGTSGILGRGGEGFSALLEGTPTSGGGGGGLYGGGGGGQCFQPPGATAARAGSGGGGSSGTPTGSVVSVATNSHVPAGVTVTAPVPVVSEPAELSGEAVVGDILSEGHGVWTTGSPLTGFVYQWERCTTAVACAAIAGATTQAYTLTTGDVGDTIRVQEEATNFYGTGAGSLSSLSGVVKAPSVVTGASHTGEQSEPRQPAQPTSDSTPVLSKVSETAKTWREASRLAQISVRQSAAVKRLPIGTTFSFSLNEPASATLGFTQQVSGHMSGGGCRKPTRTNMHGKRCTRTVVAGHLAFAAHSGENDVRFEGLISRQKKLKPGIYTVLLSASSAGKRSAISKLRCTIAK